MTTVTLNRLRTQISTLSKSERAALAHEIIAGLDGVRDGAVEQAWDDEIMRRMAQVESGQAELLAREEFRQQMRIRMGS
jgi:putative addiction module component (TIGR02574 family)